MTVPILQSKRYQEENWTVSFVMPRTYTYEKIPEPGSSDITVIEEDSFQVASVRFRGRWKDEIFKGHELRLKHWIEGKGEYKFVRIIYAFYNGPMNPGFRRWNEIFLELK